MGIIEADEKKFHFEKGAFYFGLILCVVIFLLWFSSYRNELTDLTENNKKLIKEIEKLKRSDMFAYQQAVSL